MEHENITNGMLHLGSGSEVSSICCSSDRDGSLELNQFLNTHLMVTRIKPTWSEARAGKVYMVL